jgi:hypothetical protein
MQFLAPLFLAALAAVGIPVILHLIQREKREAVPFPSLMFLSRIPHRSTRRRRLRDLPLLALRVLALVLLAAAFARPLLQRDSGVGAAGAPATETVVLLDRSYSMRYGDRWARAADAVRAEIARLGPADRLSIIAFDDGAAVAAQPTADAAVLRAALDGLAPGWSVTRYDPALRLAANLLASSALPRREVVLVSDHQRSGLGDGLETRLPAGVELRSVALGAGGGANLAVAGVSFRREQFGGQERVVATARIVNSSDEPVENAGVKLLLDGREVQTARASVAPHAAASVVLPAFTLSRAVRGEVRLDGDALPADDVQHFALAPGQAVDVLAVEGRAGSSLFLARALEVGGEPGFRVEARRSAAGPLAGSDVVVLNDAGVSPGDVAALRRFVAGGGGVIVALGPGGGGAGLDDLLPGRPGQVVDRTQGGGAALGYIDLEHPVFELFRMPRSGDLAAPRFYRYRPLQVAPGADSVAVLARFDDGGVALAERRIGRGRVLAWASTLDREWNDLAVQPLFVPFVHQLVKHAGGWAEPAAGRTVGEVVDVRGNTLAVDQPLLAIAPDGSRTEIPPGDRALTLAQRGFYTVRPAGRDDAEPVVIAANVDVRESDLATLDPDSLAASVRTPGEAVRASAAALPAAELEKRQSLWWYLLGVALALLAVETVLSNRASRAARRAKEA